MENAGSAPQWRWRRFLNRGIKFRVEEPTQGPFEQMPDGSGLLIENVPYLSLSQAANCLADAIGKGAADGTVALYNGLVEGSLPATLRAAAPAHNDVTMTGDVSLSLEFWKRTWWPGVPMGNSKPSDEWVGWFLTGGIVVPVGALEKLAEPLVQVAKLELAKLSLDMLLQHEGTVRTNFQLFWTATDVLAWIISRSDAEVASILHAIHPLSSDKRTPPWATLDAIAERHCPPGKQGWGMLYEAAMDLAARLHGGQLQAKEWPLGGADLLPLEPADFDCARFMHGTNSGGLIGGGFVGRVDHYVMIRPDEVKALWPADQRNSASDPAPLSPATAQPKRKGRTPGTGYGTKDAPFVEKAMQLRRDGKAKSANEAAQTIVHEYENEIAGTNFNAKHSRIRKAVTALEKNGA